MANRSQVAVLEDIKRLLAILAKYTAKEMDGPELRFVYDIIDEIEGKEDGGSRLSAQD